jgi:hypothetical protein
MGNKKYLNIVDELFLFHHLHYHSALFVVRHTTLVYIKIVKCLRKNVINKH